LPQAKTGDVAASALQCGIHQGAVPLEIFRVNQSQQIMQARELPDCGEAKEFAGSFAMPERSGIPIPLQRQHPRARQRLLGESFAGMLRFLPPRLDRLVERHDHLGLSLAELSFAETLFGDAEDSFAQANFALALGFGRRDTHELGHRVTQERLPR
jgi:hypothetical protein